MSDLDLQVGIPVLGVVENMCGLRQMATGFRYKQIGADGKEVDVTQQLLELIKQRAGEEVVFLQRCRMFRNQSS